MFMHTTVHYQNNMPCLEVLIMNICVFKDVFVCEESTRDIESLYVPELYGLADT